MSGAVVPSVRTSLVPGRFGRLGAKRRLQRNVSADSRDIEISPVTCIRGGVRKAWMVLPVRDCLGRPCAVVSVSSAWLMNVLDGARRSQAYAGAIGNFVKECVEQYGKLVSEISGFFEARSPNGDLALLVGSKSLG